MQGKGMQNKDKVPNGHVLDRRLWRSVLPSDANSELHPITRMITGRTQYASLCSRWSNLNELATAFGWRRLYRAVGS